MGGFKPPQARNKPFGGKGRGRRDGDAAPITGGGEKLGRLLQAIKGLAQGGKGGLRRVGEKKTF